MRLVLDTNVVVAGLLWHGTPRTLMELALDDAVMFYSSQTLVEELRHTLAYRKFTTRIARYQTSIDALTAQIRRDCFLGHPGSDFSDGSPRTLDRSRRTGRASTERSTAREQRNDKEGETKGRQLHGREIASEI